MRKSYQNRVLLEGRNVEKIVKDRRLFEMKQLMIQADDRIGVIGRNGSGKTTLLRMLAGELPVDAGEIMTTAERYYLPQFKLASTDKSGGEAAKIEIDQALAVKADILLADEPTANLDRARISELTTRLKRYRGAVVIVSHDRDFLDQLCTKIWAVENETIVEYKGNYSAYKQQRELKQKQQQKEYEAYTAKKKQLEQAAEQKRKNAEKMIKPPSKRLSTSESRLGKMKYATKQKKVHQNRKALESRVEKLEQVEKPKADAEIKMELPAAHRMKGRTVIRANQLTVRIGEHVLLRDATFSIKGGEKVAIVGENGAGKTTLLKQMLAGHPEIKCLPTMKAGYFSQTIDVLDMEATILENVQATSSQSEELIRTVLARLQFVGEDVYKQVRVLSGGEKVKTALAKVFLSDMNVLVMDEPTNYLDIETVEALEQLLKEYEGTVLFASHDIYFIKEVATKIIDIQSGVITSFEGTYQQFIERNLQSKQDPLQEELLRVETKLAEVIGKLSEAPSETLEEEFQVLIKKKNELQRQRGISEKG